MAADSNSIARRSARISYISTIIGISLVLFMLGLVGWSVLIAKKVTKKTRESIRIDVFFRENVRDADMLQLEKTLAAETYVRSSRFVSKEEALKITAEILEDANLIDPLDNYNPINASVEIYLKEEYTTPDSVKKIADNLMAQYGNQNAAGGNLINRVSYDEAMFMTINENSSLLVYIVIGFSMLLLVVAIALINNTIRLSIYSKRFLIRTMQLVGASESFIRRPFMLKALLQGLIAAVIAHGLILALLNYAGSWWSDLHEPQDLPMLLGLFGAITLLGVLISWISTYFALWKYLRIKSDYLY
jgi:cell division transport system permease protein